MTFAYFMSRRSRPAPGVNFARIPRRKFEQHCAAIERQRDNAIGQRRAHADWVSSWLQQRADAYRADAAHLERALRPDKALPKPRMTAAEYRVVADELTQLALDLDHGDFRERTSE